MSDNKNTLSNNKHTPLQGRGETGKLRVGIIGGAGYTGGDFFDLIRFTYQLSISET